MAIRTINSLGAATVANVSNLITVEWPLEHRKFKRFSILTMCFNPCYDGMAIRTLPAPAAKGQSVVSILVMTEWPLEQSWPRLSGHNTSRFNPCYDGMAIRTFDGILLHHLVP